MQNKKILITGASSGIGRGTAIHLSKLGCQLVLVGRDRGRLQATFHELRGERHQFHAFDLSDVDAIPELLKSVSKDLPLDGVFHSAGIAAIKPLSLVKQKSIDEIMDASFKAGMLLVKGFCSRGVGNPIGGSIVMMSSVSSLRGQIGMSVYSASKGAIDAAVRSLALELADRRIRINSIAAGAVKTEMHHKVTNTLSEQGVREFEQRHPLGFGEVSDIAEAATFLLSDAAKWITGSTLVVDGGYCCR
jgi:NAD(P)-dependent dehydrogenase (short-subunit alcohol dehydrogenase family)